jgi:YD repeat-containing protein
MTRFAVGLSRVRSDFSLVSISCLILLCPLVSVPSLAQQYPYAGFPLFSTQNGSQYDLIDLADSNISLSLPLRSIQAGPMPLSFTLFGASNAYQWDNPSLGGTVWAITTPSFSILQNVGANLSAYSSEPTTCNGNADTVYTNISVTDANGTVHPLNPNIVQDSGGCDPLPNPPAQQTVDGSGYTFLFTGFGLQGTLYDKFGNTYAGIPSYNLIAKTPDGITGLTTTTTYHGTGCAGGLCMTVTDALSSTPVISYQASATNGGAATYTYTNAQGNFINPPYTVSYSPYTQVTSFLCSNIGEYGPLAKYLPTSITTPTSGTYTITYETTPNYSSKTYPPPYTTGRIASITLPSGGAISYAYEGGNNGVNCTSGVIPTLIRTVNDNNGNVSSWKYVNSNDNLWSSNNPTNFTVTVTDPGQNQTVYNFAGQIQTQIATYQGGCPTSITGCNGGGTLLKSAFTCYNGNFTNCETANSVALPITETAVYTSLGSSSQDFVQTNYDSYGDVTSVINMDYGNVGSNGQCISATAGVCEKTTITYGSWNGSSCAALSNYIYAVPCDVKIANNNTGVVVSETRYTNNADGKPAAVSRWTGATENTWLTTTFGYGANGAAAGVLSSVTDVNNAITSYGNFACNGMLPGSTTYPLSSVGSDSQSWDCNGGVKIQYTDVNGHPTTYSYTSNGADPLYRIKSVTNPDGGVVNYSYSTGSSLPWSIATSTQIGVNESTITSTAVLDGLGRAVLASKGQYSSSTDPNAGGGLKYGGVQYNNLGQVATSYTPYFTSTDQTYGYTTFTYDALGRVTNESLPSFQNIVATYTNRAVTVAQFPNAQNYQTISQIDSLGRIVDVCKITATTQANGDAPQSCGLDASGTGFNTSNTYDALGNLLTSTVGSNAANPETASFSYDGLSRTTAVKTEDGETITYTYDAVTKGDLSTRTAPLENQTGSSTVVATYSWDAMHRPVQVYYNDGITPTITHVYDQSSLWSTTLPNPKGRLTSTATSAANVNGNGTDAIYGYDSMGRVSVYGQCAIAGCLASTPVRFIKNYTYNYAGLPITGMDNIVGGVTMTPAYNSIGQLNGLGTNCLTMDGSSCEAGNVFTGATYNALGQPVSSTLGIGSGLTESWSYGVNAALTGADSYSREGKNVTPTVPESPHCRMRITARIGG